MDNMTMPFNVDFGDSFFTALFQGTLNTFVNRVEHNGFCYTSFGEMHDARCYGNHHYPRDAAEAARLLARCGYSDIGLRILRFSLDNTPKDQYYIPHVLHKDGSIQANTIQVDTPAHLALALRRIVDIAGASDESYRLYGILRRIMDGTWEHHFHSNWNLLDAGNYNEQVDGGQEMICDLFTNCSMAAAMQNMRVLAGVFRDSAGGERYEEQYEALCRGIDEILYDPEAGLYQAYRRVKDGTYCNEVNWLNLYPQRWYPGIAEAWDRAFSILKDTTAIEWGRWKIITGMPAKIQILGKVFGHILSYLAQTGRFEELAEHLDFARNTIRHPSDVFPEWWYYRRDPQPQEYWEIFWRRWGNTWQPYLENPDGDYTVDSGNCEQCAVFLLHLIEDVLGVDADASPRTLSPKLPMLFDSVRVNSAPIRRSGINYQEIGYNVTTSSRGVEIVVKDSGLGVSHVTLPVPRDMKFTVHTSPASHSICVTRTCGEVQFVTVSLPESRGPEFRISIQFSSSSTSIS